MKTKNRIRSTKTNQTREREIMYRYFCSPWEARTSAWYLALQVSRGYKIVVLTRAPIAPDVASDIDSRSTGDDDDEEEDISLSLSLSRSIYIYIWYDDDHQLLLHSVYNFLYGRMFIKLEILCAIKL